MKSCRRVASKVFFFFLGEQNKGNNSKVREKHCLGAGVERQLPKPAHDLGALTTWLANGVVFAALQESDQNRKFKFSNALETFTENDVLEHFPNSRRESHKKTGNI